jgi:tetratricopeptide (TPR) repeat protein
MESVSPVQGKPQLSWLLRVSALFVLLAVVVTAWRIAWPSALKQGQRYLSQGQYDQAIAAYSEAIQENPGDQQAYYGRAEAYRYLRDYDRMLADYSQVVALYPTDAEAYRMRAYGYQHFAITDERALADYTRSIELKPDDPKGYQKRVEIYEHNGDDTNLIADYTRLIELQPEQSQSYCKRGLIYARRSVESGDAADRELAIADGKRAMAIHRANGYRCRMDIATAINAPDISIGIITEMIALEPTDPELYDQRALAHLRLQQYDQAIADYQKVVELQPDNGRALLLLGNAYGYAGDGERALAVYSQTLALNPTDDLRGQLSSAYHSLALEAVHANDYERALAHYRTAQSLDPEDDDLLEDIARVYITRGVEAHRSGDYAEALSDFNLALQEVPDDTTTLGWMAVTYEKMGKYDDAIAIYTRLLADNPNLPYYYYQRGLAYAAQGSPEWAIADLNQALALNADGELRQQIKDQIQLLGVK